MNDQLNEFNKNKNNNQLNEYNKNNKNNQLNEYNNNNNNNIYKSLLYPPPECDSGHRRYTNE